MYVECMGIPGFMVVASPQKSVHCYWDQEDKVAVFFT